MAPLRNEGVLRRREARRRRGFSSKITIVREGVKMTEGLPLNPNGSYELTFADITWHPDC